MTTKERIVDEALSLFSKKGYKGTSVKNIADAVGIKDSSLYKHFKSKQEILDTIVYTMRERMEGMSEAIGLPKEADMEQAVTFYAAFDENQFVEFSQKIFLFYLTDLYVSRFWRMGHMEQFQNADVYEVYAKLFFEDSISYQSALFTKMIEKKVFVETNPKVLAMNFYAPIYFLLSKYANLPDKKDDALEELALSLREFYHLYRIKL